MPPEPGHRFPPANVPISVLEAVNLGKYVAGAQLERKSAKTSRSSATSSPTSSAAPDPPFEWTPTPRLSGKSSQPPDSSAQDSPLKRASRSFHGQNSVNVASAGDIALDQIVREDPLERLVPPKSNQYSVADESSDIEQSVPHALNTGHVAVPKSASIPSQSKTELERSSGDKALLVPSTFGSQSVQPAMAMGQRDLTTNDIAGQGSHHVMMASSRSYEVPAIAKRLQDTLLVCMAHNDQVSL